MSSQGLGWIFTNLTGKEESQPSNEFNPSSSGIQKEAEQQDFNKSESDSSHGSFELVNEENISDELDEIVDDCADKLNEVSLEEVEPITVFVKVTSQCGLKFFFEISNLKQFDLFSNLETAVRGRLEKEGFGTYDVYKVNDLINNERLYLDDPLTDKHVYEAVVGPKSEEPVQKKVRVKITVNKEPSRAFQVSLGKSVVEIVHEEMGDIGEIISVKKFNSFYGNFLPCKRSYLLARKNESFHIITKEKTVTDDTLLNTAIQGLVVDLHRVQDTQLDLIRNIRSFLSKKRDDIVMAIDEVIKANVLPFVVDCLKSSSTEIQQEATWILINMSAGTREQTQAVIDSNILETLVSLIRSSDLKVAENAVWALSNMAQENNVVCAKLSALDLHRKLRVLGTVSLPVMTESFLKAIVDLIQFVCESFGKLPWSRNKTKMLQSILNIMENSSVPVVVHALKALASLTFDNESVIGIMSSQSNVALMMSLLEHENVNVQIEAFKLLGNILAGPNKEVQVYLDTNVMYIFTAKLDNAALRPPIIRCLSNIAAGHPAQVMALVHSRLIQKIIPFLDNSSDDKTHEEIAWTIGNLVECSGHDFRQLKYIINSGIFSSIQKRLNTDAFKENMVRPQLNKSVKNFAAKCSKVSKELYQLFVLSLN